MIFYTLYVLEKHIGMTNIRSELPTNINKVEKPFNSLKH